MERMNNEEHNVDLSLSKLAIPLAKWLHPTKPQSQRQKGNVASGDQKHKNNDCSYDNNDNGTYDDDERQRKTPLPLIDLRSADAFAQKYLHIPASKDNEDDIVINDDRTLTPPPPPVIVNLPFEDLLSGERSCELPPRHVEFAILLPPSPPTDDTARSRNTSPPMEQEEEMEQEKQIANFFFATSSKATSQSRKPWKVRQVISDTGQTWIDAKLLGILKSSDQFCSKQQLSQQQTYRKPQPRLWKPDVMVETVLLKLLKQQLQQDEELGQLLIWDLGCGAGRDLCFLAEELQYHLLQQNDRTTIPSNTTATTTATSTTNIIETTKFLQQRVQLVGMDNHKGSARRCIPLFKHRHVEDITDTHRLDLKHVHLLHNLITNAEKISSTGGGDNNELSKEEIKDDNDCDGNGKKRKKEVVFCLYAVRFLNRRLLEFITSEDCPLGKGTIFAMSHFCKANEGDEWNFDHPKESSVLERHELKTQFQKHGQWKVLHDELNLDGDHGRTIIQFVAQKVQDKKIDLSMSQKRIKLDDGSTT